jgi:chromosome segregation ATPase
MQERLLLRAGSAEALAEVRRIVAALPPGEQMYWEPLLDAAASLGQQAVSTLAPLLTELAQSNCSVRTRLDDQGSLVERCQEHAIRCAAELADVEQQTRVLEAELSDAEVGLMTKDFDRQALTAELEARDGQVAGLRAQLDRSAEEIAALRQRLRGS